MDSFRRAAFLLQRKGGRTCCVKVLTGHNAVTAGVRVAECRAPPLTLLFLQSPSCRGVFIFPIPPFFILSLSTI